jgi:uncharacterized membrane protein HdeD (DUF308 family)
VLSVAAGLIALLWPGITAIVLTVWVAIWAFLTGVVEVAMAFRRGEFAGERALWTLSGLISIVFGLVIASRPALGALTLATVFGLFSLMYGITLLILAFTARGPVAEPAHRADDNSSGQPA